MKRTLFYLTLVSAFFLLALQAFLPGTFSVTPESKMWIDGTSSVHDWTCDVPTLAGQLTTATDTEATTTGLESLAEVRITVPIEDIECHKGTMNKKLRKALAMEDHPAIAYTLTTTEAQPATEEADLVWATTGDVTIAGETRPVNMMVYGAPDAEGRYRLWGAADLKMSDFNIKPPTALLGTLKTGDAITVRFEVFVAPTAL